MGRYDVPPESPFAFLDDDQVRAWYAYMKVHLRLRYEMNHQLQADAGVSLADYDVLVALTSDQDGSMTVSDLATRIGAERSRVHLEDRKLRKRTQLLAVFFDVPTDFLNISGVRSSELLKGRHRGIEIRSAAIAELRQLL